MSKLDRRSCTESLKIAWHGNRISVLVEDLKSALEFFYHPDFKGVFYDENEKVDLSTLPSYDIANQRVLKNFRRFKISSLDQNSKPSGNTLFLVGYSQEFPNQRNRISIPEHIEVRMVTPMPNGVSRVEKSFVISSLVQDQDTLITNFELIDLVGTRKFFQSSTTDRILNSR